MPIVPDAKDWTWVLDRACPECGFDTATIDTAQLAERIAVTTVAWTDVLAGPAARGRPDERTWSPLEYACHVRDVHRVYAGRVRRMLAEEDPYYENWDQDATAVAERYGEQDPAQVAQELAQAGSELATIFGAVTDEGWQRRGRRSDGAGFTVESIARYYLHDIEHHLWDVTGSLPSRRG